MATDQEMRGWARANGYPRPPLAKGDDGSANRYPTRKGQTMYGITATRTFRVGESSSTTQVPTFYLDANVQGIVSEEHARKIAMDILTVGVGMNERDSVEFHITAVKL